MENKESKPLRLKRRAIKNILPHRGRMLLLDEVEINAEEVVGKFKVRRRHCKGHAVLRKKELVLRGCELYDMAAQLLGVWAAQYPGFQGKDAMVRSYGNSIFRKPVLVGREVTIKIKKDVISSRVFRGGKLVIIIGKKFEIKTGDAVAAEIRDVELVCSEFDISLIQA